MMKKSQEFHFLCRSAEMDFHCPRNVSVNLEYNALCIYIEYTCTCLSREKKQLEFCIGGWECMLQPYTESATALSDYYCIDDEEIA